MVAEYIQSIEVQAMADEIQYVHLMRMYESYVTDEDNPQDGKATPEEIRQIWNVDKLFLECSKSEALTQYSLVGLKNDYPVISRRPDGGLEGETKIYDIPRTVHEYDAAGAVVASFENCILKPANFEGYDLSAFEYIIIGIEHL